MSPRASRQAPGGINFTVDANANPPPDAVPLEPIFERLINPKTGEQVIRPLARSATRNGRIYFQPMPLIFGVPVRAKMPVRRSTMSLPPRSDADGKCVDPDTGAIWYEPVVYIVEQAAHPNGRLVPK